MQDQFEDLIIDNSGKKNKQKALLFKVILFVVIVLIVALGFKITSSPAATTPAEPKADLLSKDNSTNQFEPLKAQVEDVHDDDFGSLSERLSAENDVPIAEPNAPLANKPAPAQTEASKAPEAKPAPVVVSKPAETNKATEASKPIEASKAPSVVAPLAPSKTAKPAETKVKKVPKQTERSVFDSLNLPEVKELPKPAASAVAPEIKAPEASVDDGYYVQVYAGKKLDLKSHEIKLLDNLNLKYQVVKAGNLERVIVGPYSPQQRDQALKFIRAKVKKDAFFYHKK